MIQNVIFKNDEKITIEMTGKQLYDITVKNPERVADGFYRGFNFYVLTMGSHPCAYVDVTETELNGKDYESIDIKCHYGLTYSRKYLNTVDKKGWFIGWDYAHYNDFFAFNDRLAKEFGEPYRAHKYTLTEIVKECINVIDQIVALSGIINYDSKCDFKITGKQLYVTTVKRSERVAYKHGMNVSGYFNMNDRQAEFDYTTENGGRLKE